MNAFIVELENRPGALARVTGALGTAGVNITTGAGIGFGSTGGFGFLTDDETGASAALKSANVAFRTIAAVTSNVADQAGGLAAVARRLADAGVNVELVVPMGMAGGQMVVAFGVDSAEKARSALG
ncbi:MAG: ACT domain-containing protein [Chloroflexi bacterium]|nr:ACT domain-containing protein [Chloroflexota bacterium]